MAHIITTLGDITEQRVDAIVNAANGRMRGATGGVDGAIHRRGGPEILRDCISRFPHGLGPGDAGWTTAGNLPARWVIHTVGPDHSDGQRDRELLASCYRLGLERADELGARDIAFPIIGTGICGWPLADAINVAIDTLATAPTGVEEVHIVAFNQHSHERVQAALELRTPIRVLQGVRALHRRGYHRVRVLPGVSPSGMYWRVTISTDDETSAIGYTTGNRTQFASGNVTVTSDPESVADLILASLPGLVPTSDDPAYAAWFDSLIRKVESTAKLPIAYADYFDDTDGWEVGWGSGIRHCHPPTTQSPAERRS